MQKNRFLVAFFAVCLASTVAAWAAPKPKKGASAPAAKTTAGEAAPTTGSAAAPDPIPLGNAAEDPETSRAVMQILADAARQYADVRALRATGTYIEAGKVERNGKTVEEQSASQIELLFRRPDKLRISITGQEIAAGFVADGSTVTLLWPNKKQYRQLSQPGSLAAFAEEERAGEILEDPTNAIVYSVVGALLISEDPLRWLHANVQTYIYDGVEEVRGRPAWRIKFLQTDPEIVVINWIDKETKLLSRVSIISARDSEGDFVEAYADASYGRIRIAVFDRIETGEQVATDKDFAFKVPGNWQARKVEAAAKPSRQAELSGWQRLVRAAAAQKTEATSPSLTAEAGGDLLTLSRVLGRGKKVTALATGEESGGKRTLLAASAGSLAVLDPEGKVIGEISVTGEPGLLALAKGGGESARPVIAAAEVYGGTVRGYDPAGRLLWTYEHPGARISSLLGAQAPGEQHDSFYVGYLDDTGFRRLAPDGKVLFASRRLSGITSLAAGEIPGLGWRVAASTGNGGGFFSSRGELLSRIPEDSSDLQVGLLALDDSEPSAPLVQVAAVGDGEYVLRRVRLDGSPVWTVPLAQEADQAEPVGLVLAKLKLRRNQPSAAGTTESRNNGTTATVGVTSETGTPGARSESCLVTLLSDGRLAIVSARGETVWRGRAGFGKAASGDVNQVATSLAAVDLDGDGDEELYLGGEGGILRVEPAR